MDIIENFEKQLDLALFRADNYGSKGDSIFFKKFLSDRFKNYFKEEIINFSKRHFSIVIDNTDTDLENLLNELGKEFDIDLIFNFLEKKGIPCKDEIKDKKNRKKIITQFLNNCKYHYDYEIINDQIKSFLRNKGFINGDGILNEEEIKNFLMKIENKLNESIEIAKKQRKKHVKNKDPQKVNDTPRENNFLDLTEEDIIAFFILGSVYNSRDSKFVKKGCNTNAKNEKDGDGKTTIVFGDCHGQLLDVFEQIQGLGFFNTEKDDEPILIFLGDYIDRGEYSLETLMLITLLKIKYPEKVVMLRGNHENCGINYNYGFINEIKNFKRYITLKDKNRFIEFFNKKMKNVDFFYFFNKTKKEVNSLKIFSNESLIEEDEKKLKKIIKNIITDPDFIFEYITTSPENKINFLKDIIKEKFDKTITDAEFKVINDFTIKRFKSFNIFFKDYDIENVIISLFYENLPVVAKINDHFLCHGGITPELVSKEVGIFGVLRDSVFLSSFIKNSELFSKYPDCNDFVISDLQYNIRELIKSLTNFDLSDNLEKLSNLDDFRDFIKSLSEAFSDKPLKSKYTFKIPDFDFPEQKIKFTELDFSDKDIEFIKNELGKFCYIEKLKDFLSEDSLELPVDIINYSKKTRNLNYTTEGKIFWSEYKEFKKSFAPNSRGAGLSYGPTQLQDFSEKNKCKQVNHAHTHESMYQGNTSLCNLEESFIATFLAEACHCGTVHKIAVSGIISKDGDRVWYTNFERGKNIQIRSLAIREDKYIRIVDKIRNKEEYESLTQSIIDDEDNNEELKKILYTLDKTEEIYKKATKIKDKKTRKFLLKIFHMLSYEKMLEFCEKINEFDDKTLEELTIEQITCFKELTSETSIERPILSIRELEIMDKKQKIEPKNIEGEIVEDSVAPKLEPEIELEEKPETIERKFTLFFEKIQKSFEEIQLPKLQFPQLKMEPKNIEGEIVEDSVAPKLEPEIELEEKPETIEEKLISFVERIKDSFKNSSREDRGANGK